MVTIALHDKDAIAVLALLTSWQRNHVEPDLYLMRSTAAFKCALLICDCDKPAVSEPKATAS